MFFISAELYVFGVIIFAVLGSGVVQPWAITHNYTRISSSAIIAEDEILVNQRESGYPNTEQVS